MENVHMSPRIQSSSADPLHSKVDLMAFGVFEGKLSSQSAFAQADRALRGALSAEAGEADFTGKVGQQLELHSLGNIEARRVLVIGLGAKRVLGASDLRSFAALAARAAARLQTLALQP